MTTKSPFDPLADFNRPVRRTDPADALRLFFASVLLAAGIALSIWLVVIVYHIVTSPNEVHLVQRIMPTRTEDLTIIVPAGKIELPRHAFVLSGFLMVLLLLLPVTKIALTLIRLGAAMLQQKSGSQEATTKQEAPAR